MTRRFSADQAVFSIFMDILGVIGMMFFTAWLRPALNTLPFVVPILMDVHFPTFLFFINPLVWISSNLLLGGYNNRRNLGLAQRVWNFTRGNILASGLLAGILYFTTRDVSRLLVVSLCFFIFLFGLLWRLAAYLVVNLRHFSIDSRRLLIVGRGPVGLEVEARTKENQISNIIISGFLDDDPEKRLLYPDILGPLSDIRGVIRQKDITDVVVALPGRAFKQLDELVKSLVDVPVHIWIIPDYFHLILHSARVEEFAGIPMLDVRAEALDDFQLLLKRIFDLVIAGLLTIFTLPLMGFISIAILLDDHGPVIFQQKRVGLNGKLFTMYKFRTMRVDAEHLQNQVNRLDEQGNIIHKSRNDPRITRVGRFLRQFSLDELPQFFNVLVGNMSLVGPRPEMPFLVENYQPWQRKRFSVPQGVTGWWQIHGRSDKPMHLHTEDDLYYIQNYSLWLDIKILLQTAWVIIWGKGAY